jgi:hypothetical protein
VIHAGHAGHAGALEAVAAAQQQLSAAATHRHPDLAHAEHAAPAAPEAAPGADGGRSQTAREAARAGHAPAGAAHAAGAAAGASGLRAQPGEGEGDEPADGVPGRHTAGAPGGICRIPDAAGAGAAYAAGGPRLRGPRDRSLRAGGSCRGGARS